MLLFGGFFSLRPERIIQTLLKLSEFDKEPAFREVILAVRAMKRGWRGMGVLKREMTEGNEESCGLLDLRKALGGHLLLWGILKNIFCYSVKLSNIFYWL